MNKYGIELEMTNTNFVNVHGLSNSHNLSTCKDLAKLCSTCMQDDDFIKIVSSQFYKCKIDNVKNNLKRRYLKYWENTNKLLRR
jgi:D-alanyl-D-alanine carboxypeptidase